MRSMVIVLEELLNERETPVEEVVARHFTPTYRLRTGGVWAEWSAIARNLAHIRTMIRSVKIELLDELVLGSAYAGPHVLNIVMRDGSRQVRESYVFGTLAPDGRFETIEEATLVDPADRALPADAGGQNDACQGAERLRGHYSSRRRYPRPGAGDLRRRGPRSG